MSTSDVLLSKAGIIERCIRRVHEEYEADPDLENWTHLDAMTLNIERACQAAIDMAMHVVAREHLGIPESSAEAFDLLEQAGRLSQDIAGSMKGMVGFRNVAIHQYQKLDTSVLKWIAETGWRDLVRFCEELGVDIRP